MFFSSTTLPEPEARALSARLLAHLGDAVFHLYERERQLMQAQSVSQLHKATVLRINARAQATLLDKLSARLTDEEADVVRRARNVKPQKQRRSDQNAYRKSTAFEALLGYLYLTCPQRLQQILDWTLPESV